MSASKRYHVNVACTSCGRDVYAPHKTSAAETNLGPICQACEAAFLVAEGQAWAACFARMERQAAP